MLDFANLRERVVGSTRTKRGRALADALVPMPDFDAARIEQRRSAAVRELIARDELTVMPADDTSALTQAAGLGRTIGATELRVVGDALAAATAAQRAVRDSPALAEVVAGYVPLTPLQRAITDAIDERGAVLDRASPALGRIRRSLAQAQTDARDRVGAILRSAKYSKAIQESVVTIRNGRFVVPVKAEFSGVLPGIVHDTSASGQTLFVEPLSTLETNNRVRTLQIEEEREVQRILGQLSQQVGTQAGAIEGNVSMLAAIDLLAAKAEVARAMDAVEPELTDAAVITIERGRHPLLGARAVAQSISLDDVTRVLIISGPNMGGKTVTLKMAGLFVAMAYCGMQVPAAAARIGRFEHLIADIGDEQSIAENVSTFAAHVARMREMLALADARTLVLVDEIGGGTEPSAGAALAMAMLERLLERGARGVVTTHATELKLFAHATPGAANASVRFDPESFAPTFALDVGTPGQSLAFPLAKTLGIEEPIVDRAQRLLDDRERDYESALADLARRASELQRERERLEDELRISATALGALQKDRNAFDAQRRSFSEKAEERLREALHDFVRGLERPKVTPSQAALLARTIETMRRDLGITAREEEAGEDDTYLPGDAVHVDSLGQEGVVIEDWDDRLLVAIGAMRVTAEKRDVRRVAAGSRAAQRRRADVSAGEARVAAATRTASELDVRGKRYVEAEPLVERWIDEAILAGNSPLRLIHGKGTGMLGRGLQEYLRAHPMVKSLRYGNEDEGSTGVTILELRT